jgi:hypothetical protein
MTDRRKPKATVPFVPDCIADVMDERIPARFIRRFSMTHAWIQTADGVFTVACRDLLKA